MLGLPFRSPIVMTIGLIVSRETIAFKALHYYYKLKRARVVLPFGTCMTNDASYGLNYV